MRLLFYGGPKMLTLYTQFLDSEEDKRTFTDVYYKYEQTILKTAAHYLYNKDFCCDCLQETFIGLAKSYNIFKTLPDEKQRKYIITICIRCAIKINNLNGAQTVSLEDDIELGDGMQSDSDCFEYDFKEVVNTIKLLDDKYKIPLIMKYAYGYTLFEISQQLGISENLVKQRIFRARKMIETNVKEHGYDK